MAEGSESPRNPHDLVRWDDVEKALLAEKGDNAKLFSFHMENFTSKGDNYMCTVSSVVVTYTIDKRDDKLTTSYVVKLNPCRANNFERMGRMAFHKEIGFYSVILPFLNEELNRANEEPLRVPKCYHFVAKKGSEVIYLEDLRKSGFKMPDRYRGVDSNHCLLILKELARLHAASSILLSRWKRLESKVAEEYMYDLLAKLDNTDGQLSFYDDFLPQFIETGAGIAAQCQGYEHVAKFLLGSKRNLRTMMAQLSTVPDNFKVIIHGDCWGNNLLFR